MTRYPTRSGQRGFTLIDLAIAIAILAILAAVVAPGQLSELRSAKAEMTVRKMQLIFDAARRVHFLNSQVYSQKAGLGGPVTNLGGMNRISLTGDDDAEVNPIYASWPGQTRHPMAITTYRGRGFMDVASAKIELARVGNFVDESDPSFLAQIDKFYRNAWGLPIYFSVDSDSLGPGKFASLGEQAGNTWITLTTDVPLDIAISVKRYLPNGMCNDTSLLVPNCYMGFMAGPVPAGFERCCASIPRPGWEPEVRSWWGNLQSAAPAFCDWDDQLPTAVASTCPLYSF